MSNQNLSLSFWSSEIQVSPNVLAWVQPIPSAVYDCELGCIHTIPMTNFAVFLKCNNQNTLISGSLTVYAQFVDAINFISPKKISFLEINSAGTLGVPIYDFRKTLGAKIIFKIQVNTDFDEA